MKLLKIITLFFLTALVFLSCGKDSSEDTNNLTATGTLQSTSGVCMLASVQGIYTVATPLTADNFINVTVNITETGEYTISTNTVNGYSFSATGTATATGQQTIKLLASGTPVAAGNNTFTVTFGSSQCNIVVTVVPPAPPPSAVFSINCAGYVQAGIYKQGTATSAANTMKVPVTVTTAGVYTITTNAVNGISFSGSGTLAVGAQEITLTANGGTPVSYGYFTYTVSGGAATCTFRMFHLPSIASEDYKWSFKVGTTTYSGYTMVTDMYTPGQADIFGPDASGNEWQVDLKHGTAGGSIGIGNYPGVYATGKFTQNFYYTTTTATVFGFVPGFGTNITTDVTVYNTTTKIIEGTFSGTARQGNEDTGPIVTVTEGRFKARLP